ncbi:MAG: membrane protein insertase YidC [Bacilli bacterium]|nr:membrane protein insertase YidC [Bacilli bacterium]
MKKNKNLFLLVVLIVFLLTLSGCAKTTYMETPLGDGFGFWDIFVYPMAGIMWLVGKTIGFGDYALTIIFSTLIVRTIAWPIYAKSNDMQLKMKIMQPEIDKINAKYANKTDEQSRQRQQMETMQLYKKYGVGIGGCLMPIIQMPIFLGFYYALRKLPASMAIEGHWLNIFNNTKLFGIYLTITRTGSELSEESLAAITDFNAKVQNWGVIILAILVGLTQAISIIISEIRQKKVQKAQESGIPEYRRAQNQNPQAKSTGTAMKVMLYFFAVMMVIFVLQSPAALGLYWVVGNVYTTGQTAIGQLTSNKRLEKLKKKSLSK